MYLGKRKREYRQRPRKVSRSSPFVIHGNYVGPGNPIDDEYVREHPPVDELDRAALEHDRDPGFRYLAHTPADDRFIRRISAITPGSVSERFARRVALSWHTAKRTLFPHVNTDEAGPSSPNNVERSTSFVSNNLFNRMGVSIGSSVRGVYRPKPGVYEKFGSCGSDEQFGQIQDPNCAYVACSSLKTPYTTNTSWSGSVLFHIAAAWLRDELFRQFRFQVVDYNDPLVFVRTNAQNANTGQLHDKAPVLHFIGRCTPTQSIEVFYDHIYTMDFLAPTGQSYPRVKTFMESVMEIIQNVFLSYKSGAWLTSDRTDWRLYGYQWVVPDLAPNYATSAGQRNVGGQIHPVQYFDNIFIKAYSSSCLQFQNATVAENTEGDEYVRDRLDANPLDCALYHFQTPTPRVKAPRLQWMPPIYNTALEAGANVNEDLTEECFKNKPTYTALYDNPQSRGTLDLNDGAFLEYDDEMNGVIVPPGDKAVTGDWRRLPSEAKFRQLSSSSRFRLMPGQMRTTYLNFNFDGTIPKFLCRLHMGSAALTVVPATNTTRSYTTVLYTVSNSKAPWGPLETEQLGTCSLLAFQKMISVKQVTDVKVKVNFQVNFKAGAVVTKRKRMVLPRIDTDLYNGYETGLPVDNNTMATDDNGNGAADSTDAGGNPSN